MVNMQQHQIGRRSGIGQTAAVEGEAGVDSFSIDVQDEGVDLEIVQILHFVKEMNVHLEGIERAACALAIGRIQTQMVHQAVNRVARRQAVIGVAHMPVEIDPLRFDLHVIDRKFRQVRKLSAAAGARALEPG